MQRTTIGFFTIIMCTLVLMLTSCQQEGPAEKAGKNADKTLEEVGKKIENTGNAINNKAEIAAASLDDAAITAKIKAAIINDPLLKVSEIEVVTTDGVAQLSGTVNSQTSVERAQEIAAGVKGVKSVKNSLLTK